MKQNNKQMVCSWIWYMLKSNGIEVENGTSLDEIVKFKINNIKLK